VSYFEYRENLFVAVLSIRALKSSIKVGWYSIPKKVGIEYQYRFTLSEVDGECADTI